MLLAGDAANRVTRFILNALTFNSDCDKPSHTGNKSNDLEKKNKKKPLMSKRQSRIRPNLPNFAAAGDVSELN